MIFDNEYARVRLNKRTNLLTSNVNPYPVRFEKTHDASSVKGEYPANEGSAVRVAGRVVLLRLMGKASFATIRDGSGDLQIYLKLDNIGQESYERMKTLLDLGDVVGVSGKVFKTKTGEISVSAESWDFLAKAILPPPEKWHGLTDVETRYRKRSVDLFVNPDVRKTFEMRSRLIASIRQFFDGEGFVEVETPSMSARAGGAAARPFQTHHNALDIDLFLRVAPELHLKRLIVGGFEKIFEIGKNFRNEGVSTRHNPEFTMLESYEAYADAVRVMDFTERLLRHACRAVHGKEQISSGGREIDLGRPFRRLAYLDALKQELGQDVSPSTPADSLHALVARSGLGDKVKALEKEEGRVSPSGVLDLLFEHHVEPKLQDPTFITRHPRALSPLAKACADDPALADRFELFVGGREIANAYSEQNDPLEQLERFREQAAGDESKIDWDFVEALAYGMPPAGGLGVGIDRLFMLICDLPSIRDAILFPLLRPE